MLLLFILGIAAQARFRLPQTPFFDADYGGYLRPALSALTGHGFAHVDGRDSLYPAFIFAVLRLSGDFRAISLVQHVLGLSTGLFMALVCQRGARLLQPPVGAGGPVFTPWLALLAVAAYLSAPSAILFEQSIRPEGIFPFFAVLSIWLNLEFIRCRWIWPAAGLAAWLGAAQLVISLVAYKLKPSFGLALPLVNLPLLVSLVAPGVSVRSKIAIAAGGAAFCAVFLLWPENRLKQVDPEAYTFLPETLLTIHGDQIRDQIAADLRAGRSGPFPRATVQALLGRLNATLPASRRPENRPYPSLGFNPDYLLYTDPVFRGLGGKQSEAYRLRARLGYYYYARAFLEHPARMLGKIGGQMRLFYHFGAANHAPLFAGKGRLPADRLTGVEAGYRRNVVLYTARPTPFDAYAPGRAFIAASRQLAQQPLTLEQAPALTFVRRTLEVLYLPGFLLTLVITGWVVATGRLRTGWLWPVAVTLLLLSYNFGNNLTIAVVHSLDVGRYVDNQLAYTLLGATFNLMLLGETLRRLTRGWLIPSAAPMIGEAGSWLTAPALPALAPGNDPPSLCCLLSGGHPAEAAVAEYRALFPAARLVILDPIPEEDPKTGWTRALLTALADLGSDAFILVDARESYPAESARRLFDSFCQQPADLILGVHPRDNAASADHASRLMALVCGWRPVDLSAGPRLFSRRFYENVPLSAPGLEPVVEWTLQAIGQGFDVRVLPVPCTPSAAVAPANRRRRMASACSA